MKYDGVFSEDKNVSPLYDANKAYLRYCSSDGHMGDVGGDDAAATFEGRYFRGQRIVRAMITYLIQNEGLGQNAGDLVVFGGYSAGARGAMAHLD